LGKAKALEKLPEPGKMLAITRSTTRFFCAAIKRRSAVRRQFGGFPWLQISSLKKNVSS
jgi:hypothetical protein